MYNMAKAILNKHFNHIEDGSIARYEAGQDISHLSEATQEWLKEKGHLEEVDDKAEAPAPKPPSKSKGKN